MTEPVTNDSVFRWPWTLGWPGAGGAPGLAFAPERLWQPINTGLTFNGLVVNNTNSSAPQVEQEVVSQHSYGRQIGRLMDAVQALVQAVPKTQGDPGVQDFLALATEIEQIKQTCSAQRLERLRHELEALKQHDRKAWESLVKPGR
jgi:hypothetical protein